MDVVIAGGGIGGLTAALFLQSAGIGVTVCEAVDEVKELGVGINIQPHAVRELARLGLLEKLEAIGNPCTEWAMFNRFGQLIWREPRGTAAGHEWPQISIHRGRLQLALLDAACKWLPADRLLTGHRYTTHDEEGGRVFAQFATPNGKRAIDGDLLVGADGIHSTLRRRFYPDEGPPVFGGMLLWRGVTRMKPFLTGGSMIFAGFREQKFIAYPITRPDTDGTCLVNWIAEIHADRMLNREDWNRPGRLEDFLPSYESWRFDWLDVPEVITRADAIYEYPMVDRDPLPNWRHGRATLLGDAAHPMYPIGANGASQAIRDGAALADALLETENVIAGLVSYEEDRREATAAIVLSNRGLGPEQVMQIVHERAPGGFAAIEDVISLQELKAVSDRYRQVTWASRPDR